MSHTCHRVKMRTSTQHSQHWQLVSIQHSGFFTNVIMLLFIIYYVMLSSTCPLVKWPHNILQHSSRKPKATNFNFPNFNSPNHSLLTLTSLWHSERQVPMLECHNADEVVLPEFGFAKHQPAVIERLKVEIGGSGNVANFCNKVCKTRKSKDKDKESELAAMSLTDLLQPKKKKRVGGAKAKAAPKAAASSEAAEGAATIQADVAQAGGTSRKRWWIDDLLACLVHAAGDLSTSYSTLSTQLI